jgi:ABC-2 type transport system permease protein|tara:strand:+ start:73 stop:819 length:747 start_codon:yes stop_codon:yes gene_type:complete
MINNIILIASNELRRFFKSPLAWIILALVQFLVAIFFYVPLVTYLQPASVASGLTDAVVSTMYGFAAYVILIISPLITMRLIAEERQLGTIKLLFSSPISITEIVLGKFFGITIFYILILMLITLMPASLLFGTHLDLGQVASAFIGLLLLMTSIASIGLFLSSLTNSPVIAAISTFGVLFFLLIIKIGGTNSSLETAEIFSYLSLVDHYNNFLSGLFNSIDFFYYILLTIFFIILCIWRLDTERIYG